MKGEGMTPELRERLKKYLIGDIEQIMEDLQREYIIGSYFY